MKFVLASSDLLAQLTCLSGIIPTKAHLPAIQFLNLRIENQELVMTSTDLEIWMRTSSVVDLLEEGELNISVPHREIIDTLKNIPEQPVTFSWNKDDGKFNLRTSNGLYSIAAHDHTSMEYPRFPSLEGEKSLTIPLKALVRSIQKTLFAASTDDLKPAMNGLYFHLQPTQINFVATDAHRLSCYTRTDLQFETETSFILPHKGLKHFLTAANQADSTEVKLRFDSYNAILEFDHTVLVCRMIDGRFPDYRMVIPQANPNKAVMQKKDLLASMKRLDIYSNKVTHLGVFRFVGNILKMESQDIANQHKAEEQISTLYEGEELTIGFNLSLMKDVIQNVDTDDVLLDMDTPSRPVVVQPSEHESGEELLMLLMPVMLGVGY
jgi:DNA polymerase-3 subunit beta